MNRDMLRPARDLALSRDGARSPIAHMNCVIQPTRLSLSKA